MSWAKNLNTTTEFVLWEMSWQNLILYTAATPQYDDEKVDDGVRDDVNWDRFDACDTNNFNDLPEYIK